MARAKSLESLSGMTSSFPALCARRTGPHVRRADMHGARSISAASQRERTRCRATAVERGTRRVSKGARGRSCYAPLTMRTVLPLRQDGGWRTASWGLAAQAVKLFEGRLLLLSKASAPKWNCPNYSQARAAASSPCSKKHTTTNALACPGREPRPQRRGATPRGAFGTTVASRIQQ
jgi:hypothetical protein